LVLRPDSSKWEVAFVDLLFAVVYEPLFQPHMSSLAASAQKQALIAGVLLRRCLPLLAAGSEPPAAAAAAAAAAGESAASIETRLESLAKLCAVSVSAACAVGWRLSWRGLAAELVALRRLRVLQMALSPQQPAGVPLDVQRRARLWQTC
jgi:hypothetical protein